MEGRNIKIGIMRMVITVLLASGTIATATSAAAYKYDYVNFGMNAAYSTLIGRCDGMKVMGGLSAGLHLGYEYREGRFWLSATGEFQYLSSNCQSEVTVRSINFQDTRLTNAVMNYEMLSNLEESQNFGMANACLMLGYHQGKQSKVNLYFGAGVKVGMKFDIRNTTSLRYRTYATYEEYIDPYEGMGNHYYTNHESSDTVSFGNKPDISLAGEFGLDINLSRCNKMKVGLFVEAGVTDIMKGVPVREMKINPENVTVIKAYSAYNHEAMADRYIVPIVAGVRLSILFNMSKARRNCTTCVCHRNR